ncbi:hypothetical protein SBOR_8977 [Sclerotinia borealis F-4128]|uniref:Uncharacterized protein n=1 Tax=Sclerotinia borealis (strain F-4128) TaxID=1432307 RepID=W9C4J3_SCLBF|nr:hypothetical protein SBOR_8977 [Sclerotinia borealis F-4128]
MASLPKKQQEDTLPLSSTRSTRLPAEKRVPSSSKHSKRDDSDSESGNRHGNKSKQPEEKRSSKINLPSLSLLRGSSTKEEKELQLKFERLQATRPDDFAWVNAYQPLKLSEKTLSENKQALENLEKKLKRISEDIIDFQNIIIPTSRAKRNAAQKFYYEVRDKDDEVIRQQKVILDKFPDTNPYKIKVFKEAEKNALKIEKSYKKEEKKRNTQEAKKKEDEKTATDARRKAALELDKGAERAAYDKKRRNPVIS